MSRLTRTLCATVLLSAVAVLGARYTLAQDKPAPKSVTETLRSLPNTKTFVGIVDKIGITAMFDSPMGFTFFVPSDDAFKKWGGRDRLDKMGGAHTPELIRLLQNCIVSQKLMAADLKEGELKTNGGTPLIVAMDGDKVTINGAPITTADIATTSSVIHVVEVVPDKKK